MSVELHTRCPLCDSEGWVSFTRLEGYTAICGTTWGNDIEPRQAPACHIIQQLRIDNALLRLGVAA